MTQVGSGKRVTILIYIIAVLGVAALLVGLGGCGTASGEADNVGNAGDAAVSADADEASANQGNPPIAIAEENVDARSFQRSRPELMDGKCRSTCYGLIMKWRRVAGAEKYEVFRAETVDGEYELVKEIEQPELPTFAGEEDAAEGGNEVDADEMDSEEAVDAEAEEWSAKRYNTSAAVQDRQDATEIECKMDADGEYFYKVRAVWGELYSKWSLTMRTCSVSGYVTKMSHDKYGYTHFEVSLTNRTERPVYLYGTGLYDGAIDPHYQIEKFNDVTGDKVGAPYPLTAALKCKANNMIEVPAGAKEQKVDIYIPQTLEMYGETGMLEEEPEEDAEKDDGDADVEAGDQVNPGNLPPRFGYRVKLQFYPNMESPTFELTATGEEKQSKTLMRIAHGKEGKIDEKSDSE